jgi:hypothetical protein
LYLTSDTKVLKLTEARLLTDLVETYVNPVKNTTTSKLEVADENRGLYIADLTDKDNANATTNITTLNIAGGGLGYNSYKLLERFYNAAGKNSSVTRKVSLTDVQWSPYTLVEDTEAEYDTNSQYYIDNGHFGLEPYTYSTATDWQLNLNNKVIYLYDPEVSGIQFNEANEPTNITSPELFKNIGENASYMQNLSGDNIPNITGIVYINNDEEIDEGDIQSEYQDKYPNLTFFFKTVKKGYSARFIIQQGTTQTLVGSQKISNDKYSEDIFFAKPSFSLSELKDYMPNYNFLGWATDAEGTNMVMTWTALKPDDGTTQSAQTIETDLWDTLRLTKDQSDYTFYAIYTIKQYVARFYDGDMVTYNDVIVDDGSLLYAPESFIPTLDDSKLDLEVTYAHTGWRKLNLNETPSDLTTGVATDLSKGLPLSGYTRFAPIFKQASVYDNVLSESLFNVTDNGTNVTINLKEDIKLSGKITLPIVAGGKPVGILGSSALSSESKSTIGITHVFWAKGDRQITTISNRALYRLSSMVYFEMPESVTSLDTYAFNGCSKLFSYNGVAQTDVDKWFSHLVEIKSSCFVGCSSFLSELNLPGCLMVIGSQAFRNLRTITKLTFGGSGDDSQLSEVGGNAFQNLELTSLTYYSTKSDVEWDGFISQAGCSYGTLNRLKP